MTPLVLGDITLLLLYVFIQVLIIVFNINQIYFLIVNEKSKKTLKYLVEKKEKKTEVILRILFRLSRLNSLEWVYNQ